MEDVIQSKPDVRKYHMVKNKKDLSGEQKILEAAKNIFFMYFTN